MSVAKKSFPLNTRKNTDNSERYRELATKAYRKNDNLRDDNLRDKDVLQSIEDQIEIMNFAISEKRVEKSNNNVGDTLSEINIDDCIRIKELAKKKARDNLAVKLKEERIFPEELGDVDANFEFDRRFSNDFDFDKKDNFEMNDHIAVLKPAFITSNVSVEKTSSKKNLKVQSSLGQRSSLKSSDKTLVVKKPVKVSCSENTTINKPVSRRNSNVSNHNGSSEITQSEPISQSQPQSQQQFNDIEEGECDRNDSGRALLWSELPLSERQEIWLKKREAKQLEIKKEKEVEAVKELSLAPNLTSTKESWEAAKRKHARELQRQLQEEETRLHLAEMKAQLKQLKLEERIVQLQQQQQHPSHLNNNNNNNNSNNNNHHHHPHHPHPHPSIQSQSIHSSSTNKTKTKKKLKSQRASMRDNEDDDDDEDISTQKQNHKDDGPILAVSQSRFFDTNFEHWADEKAHNDIEDVTTGKVKRTIPPNKIFTENNGTKGKRKSNRKSINHKPTNVRDQRLVQGNVSIYQKKDVGVVVVGYPSDSDDDDSINSNNDNDDNEDDGKRNKSSSSGVLIDSSSRSKYESQGMTVSDTISSRGQIVFDEKEREEEEEDDDDENKEIYQRYQEENLLPNNPLGGGTVYQEEQEEEDGENVKDEDDNRREYETDFEEEEEEEVHGGNERNKDTVPKITPYPYPQMSSFPSNAAATQSHTTTNPFIASSSHYKDQYHQPLSLVPSSSMSPITVSNSTGITSSTPFSFDPSSTQDKGRFRLRDARDFEPKSMHRKQDPICSAVTLLKGIHKETGQEEVITILFDRREFSEETAGDWWSDNKDRFL